LQPDLRSMDRPSARILLTMRARSPAVAAAATGIVVLALIRWTVRTSEAVLRAGRA
jgi:hypothetical protein